MIETLYKGELESGSFAEFIHFINNKMACIEPEYRDSAKIWFDVNHRFDMFVEITYERPE